MGHVLHHLNGASWDIPVRPYGRGSQEAARKAMPNPESTTHRRGSSIGPNERHNRGTRWTLWESGNDTSTWRVFQHELRDR